VGRLSFCSLLADEFDEVASDTLGNAGSLADRAAVLGSEITADPTDFLADSPFDEFSVPEDSSDVGAILNYAAGQPRGIIAAYEALIDQVRGEDDLTYLVVVRRGVGSTCCASRRARSTCSDVIGDGA